MRLSPRLFETALTNESESHQSPYCVLSGVRPPYTGLKSLPCVHRRPLPQPGSMCSLHNLIATNRGFPFGLKDSRA